MQYENRIKLLSKSLRAKLGNHSELIGSILEFLPILEYGPIDGGVFTDSFEFDSEHEEVVFFCKGGPAIRVARKLSELYLGVKVRINWQADNFQKGKEIYASGVCIDALTQIKYLEINNTR
jgi:hypothetical protein